MKMENTSLSISVCFLVLLFKFPQTQKRKVAVSQTLLYTLTHTQKVEGGGVQPTLSPSIRCDLNVQKRLRLLRY